MTHNPLSILVAIATAILLCALAGCTNQVGPAATTQPIFGPDSVHVTIIVEKVEVGPPVVNAPITATANITVNGHVFSATAPASQPASQPAPSPSRQSAGNESAKTK